LIDSRFAGDRSLVGRRDPPGLIRDTDGRRLTRRPSLSERPTGGARHADRSGAGPAGRYH
ncbi:MAG TPA: hypothetical protein VJZ50_01110, partial [Candidatus Limnocylindrales bacterium]|nr:hypothetical protein [Candidatus Limnocylindrales bacterium]